MKKNTINVSLVAGLIGMFDSIYLAVVKLSHIPIYCTPGLGDCATVNSSPWSLLWGIPVSIFGIATYLGIICLVLFGNKIPFIRPYTSYLLFGIGFFGFLFSLYLTYIELFVLHAICQWCMLSAGCMTVIFIISILELFGTQEKHNK
ncbi:MAG: vitamin K epoxide reductase family protein [Chloroflexi bacterium]|nr:vitamin K epoxide reductase family protein [Chloroflexota bacterium]